jgi:GxxExxY protein
MSNVVTTMPHASITDKIIAAFYDVYNEIGCGYVESVYHTCLTIALRSRGLLTNQEIPLDVYFRGNVVARFRADLIVENSVIVELKACRTILAEHEVQLVNYLRCTAVEVGLILNFGPKPQIKRSIFTNDRKHTNTSRVREVGTRTNEESLLP